MRAGLVQLTSGPDPEANLPVTLRLVREAAAGGAQLVLTPEITNLVTSDRAHQRAMLRPETEDATLAAFVVEARALGIWILIGSLALETGDPDGRFANRSFLTDPQGAVTAQYDKIHMFDVQVTPEETYRESDGYRPGTRAVLAETPFGRVGMTICYDLRFPQLFRDLAQAGADILTVPAAFSHVTGAAHWESLLRARAIETGCYVLAPAQTGTHAAQKGAMRRTYGHSMAIAPWGEVLVDAGEACGISYVDLDLGKVADSRRKVPSLEHDRNYDGP